MTDRGRDRRTEGRRDRGKKERRMREGGREVERKEGRERGRGEEEGKVGFSKDEIMWVCRSFLL